MADSDSLEQTMTTFAGTGERRGANDAVGPFFYYVFNYNGVYSLARWMRTFSWN